MIALDVCQCKAMSSAVLDRVLAIPDYGDRPQMGLSKAGLAAIVERGGITEDGTKAKASVLKRAGIKGDRKLTPEIAAKAKKAIANRKPKTAKEIAVPTKEQILSSFKSDVPLAKGSLNDGNFAYSDNNSYVIKVAKGRKNSESYEVYSQGITGATRKATIDASMQDALTKVADAVTKINQSPDIVTASRRSRKVIKGKSPRDRRLTPENTKIAPETAKKVKKAIGGVKGGKVVKGQKPVSGRVIESGKTGKDGFTRATVSIPLQSRNSKSGVTLGEPMKGEKIGDYHVSGDSKYGYSVTHIPSGFSVLNSSILKGELGSNDKETAKLAAKKLSEAKIPLPKTFHKMKNSKQPKIQELGRKVLSAIK